MKELGIKISGTAPNGIGAPKGIDPSIAKILENAIEKAAKDTPHVDALKKYGMNLMWQSRKDYEQYIKEIHNKERMLVERLKLKGT